VDYAFTIDSQGAVLELIKAVPNTLWDRGDSRALHHISIWVDDLTAASESLSSRGAPLVSTGATASPEPSGNAYHQLRCGLLIELAPRHR
jgi:hypothetical protein